MKYINILGALLIGLGIASCEKKEIELYGTDRYVYFTTEEEGFHETNANSDSTNISFFFYIEDDIQYPLEVGLTGAPLDKPATFKVVADTEKSDLPAELYEIPETFEFAAGQVLDTIHIRLKNDPRLLDRQYTLKIDIVDNENFKSHHGKNGRRILKISDIAEKPEWWTENPIEWNYLGEYSRLKYEHFMRATGISSLKGMDEGMIRVYSLKFKRYLENQDPAIIDEDGDPMSVEVIG